MSLNINFKTEFLKYITESKKYLGTVNSNFCRRKCHDIFNPIEQSTITKNKKKIKSRTLLLIFIGTGNEMFIQ